VDLDSHFRQHGRLDAAGAVGLFLEILLKFLIWFLARAQLGD
jgi:hypothetical protein